MHLVELSDEEFELVCISIDSSIDLFRNASDNAPNEEDARVDNEYYLKYRDFQKKFPEPPAIGLRKKEE
jgi:hypothetical protein